VLDIAHAVVQRKVGEGSAFDKAKCIDDHVRDDSLNEALILSSGAYP
jgi:hypothetical protein